MSFAVPNRLLNARRKLTRFPSNSSGTFARSHASSRPLAADGIAIRVIDAYSVQPIDRDTLVAAGRATHGRMLTVEDHYAHGGLGDAVSEAVWDQAFRVRRLAVREIPRSGTPKELIDHYGISARAIVEAVKSLVKM